MQQVNVQQGSREWLELRATTLNASEAPAMLGLSTYQSRADLLKHKHTGLADEPDQAALARFARGHQAEADFRPIAEAMIGEDLYPIVGMIELDGLRLLASFDGLTMDESVCFEHKLFNAGLGKFILENDDLPDTHWPQAEQQLLVSGAEKCFFVTSDGTIDKYTSLSYTSNPERRQRVIDGWKQFSADLANYQHVEPIRESVAEPIARLPALFIQAEGRVISSNLEPFKAAVTAMVEGIKTELVTDQDFADAEAMSKHLKDGEGRLEQAKAAALAQTASLDDLFRTVDDMADLMRQKRLLLEKLVKSEKESRKAALVMEARAEFDKHCASLNDMLLTVTMPPIDANLAGAIKGLKSIQSMKDALNSALANAKIDASSMAMRIKSMIDAVDSENARHLFPDIRTLTRTPIDSEPFMAMIHQRKQAEAARIAEAEARAAAQATAQAEAKEKREAEEVQRKHAEAEQAEMQLAYAIPSGAKITPVAPSVQPVQRTDADMVREFMKARGMDDPKMRAALIEFIKYVRSQEAQA